MSLGWCFLFFFFFFFSDHHRNCHQSRLVGFVSRALQSTSIAAVLLCQFVSPLCILVL
jgi:hypothetical protein